MVVNKLKLSTVVLMVVLDDGANPITILPFGGNILSGGSG